MAEIVFSFVVEEALSKVLSRITEEIKLAWGLKDELNRLRDSLAMVRDLLQDAEEQQKEQMAVRRWLKKLKVWAFDAEDLLDDLAYEFLRQKVEIENQGEAKGRNFSKFSFGVHFAQKTLFHTKMAHKVKNLSKSLDEIKNEAVSFGLRLISSDKKWSEISWVSMTDSIIDHPVVAREAEVSKIVNLLADCRNQRALTVAVVVGMGGIGKTTVAKLVCQEAMDKKIFDVKMWISVSTDFDEQKILGEMLQTLNKNAGGITNKDATLRHLADELEGKSFLLVLDNVWNQEYERWDRLKSRLSSITKSNGNVVLVTTRSDQVAMLMETSPQFRHKLHLLSNDECWSIIEEIVLGDSKASISSDLEAIGKEIASKCRGLPLAARVIGGTLHRKTRKEEWLAIKNSNVLNVSSSEVSVNSILRLSFDRLPFHLKACFSYCSIFPKSAFIWRIELISQWRGHGLIDSSVENAGDSYFNELLRSSFFLDAKYDEFGHIKVARMHDLMHELAVSISKSDTMTMENCSAGNDTSHIQHLNIIPYGDSGGRVPIFLRHKTKALRTLFAASADVFYDSCKFKSLRVLRLRGRNVKVLPASIGKLKHLRFLDVSYSEIRALPESITKLYNLQVLLMLECELLEKLPKRLKNLVSLNRLIFSYEKQMPSGVGCLTNLHRIVFFVVGPDRGGSIQELECLNNLRFELIISNLELVRDEEEAKKANLQSKRKLDKLELVWSGDRDYNGETAFQSHDENVLEGLQPCEELKGLVIKNYLGKQFPSWLLTMKVTTSAGDCCSLNNLVWLKLEGCRRCGEIPTAGNLPLLRKLELVGLDNVEYMGDEFYGSNEASTSNEWVLFPALKRLVIGSMGSLVEWKTPITFNAFPCLEELHISKCPKLRNIPISHLSALVEFTMEQCDAFDELVLDNVHPWSSLRLLHIGNCGNFASFQSVQDLTSLQVLRIQYCDKLISIPRRLKLYSSLRMLFIWKCHQLTSVPEDLPEIGSLASLTIVNCPNVTNFTGDILQRLTQLINLGISSLVITGQNDYKSLPDQLQNLTRIKVLQIWDFDGLEALPEWFGKFSSLELLVIGNFANLKYLPSATALQGLSQLKELKIVNCPCLKESCAKGSGSEWSKISHIPRVVIDEVILKELGT
ncbi:putative disease resistance protein RGA1 [Euphorbia lathyris]|uniref:putative disease resistance protein RGA1 n=1 Tax=Euphorbia lathyris TaxID=212925 RepID=UPI003313EA74